MIHHTGKDSESMFLGSSKIQGDIDAHIVLRPDDHLLQKRIKDQESSKFKGKKINRPKDVLFLDVLERKNRNAPQCLETRQLQIHWGLNPALKTEELRFNDDDIKSCSNIASWYAMDNNQKLALIAEKRMQRYTSSKIGTMCGVTASTINAFILKNKGVYNYKKRVKKVDKSQQMNPN